MTGETPLDPKRVAEFFSAHRFADVYDRLSTEVRWTFPGQGTVEGREAVIAACESSLAEMSQLVSTEFSRFVAVGDGQVAAVDAVGHYVNQEGSTSVVSSADIYEFDSDGSVITITSYAVELSA